MLTACQRYFPLQIFENFHISTNDHLSASLLFSDRQRCMDEALQSCLGA